VAKQSQAKLEPMFGYLRVSALMARDPEYATEPQRAKVEALARARGGRIVKWFIDTDQSGGKWERPAFLEAIAGVDGGRARAIVVAKQDRFSRSVIDTERGVKQLEAAGGRLVCGDLDVDTSTPAGKAMRQMLAVMAEFELNVRKDYWVESKARALEAGKKLAGHANLGYDFDGGRRLVPNEDADAVRELFAAAANGASIRELVELLHKRTGKRFHRQSIGSILSNRVYRGEVHYGGETVTGAHTAILTEAEWQAAQRVKRPSLKKSGTRSLLAGIARCKACGRKMGSTSSGTGVRVYRCPKFGNGLPDCPAPSSIKEEALDVFVIEAVRSWARGEGLEDHVYESRPAAEPLAKAREDLRLAESERDRWAVETAGLGLPTETVRAGLEARQTAVEDARGRLEAVEQADTSAVVRTTLRELWPDLSTAERRQLIASVVDRVEVRRLERGAGVNERAAIVWK